MCISCQQPRVSWLEVKKAVRICGSLIQPVTCTDYKGLRGPAYHSGTWIFLKGFLSSQLRHIFGTITLLTALELSTKVKNIQARKGETSWGEAEIIIVVAWHQSL